MVMRDHLGAFRHVRIAAAPAPSAATARLRRRRRSALSFGCAASARLRAPVRRLGAPVAGVPRLAAAADGLPSLSARLVLALGKDHRDRRIDRDVVGAFRHQDFAERAFVDGLDFHGRLVGLDLGDDVAGFDRVAFLLQPLGEVALLHRGRQRGHQHFDRHGVNFGLLGMYRADAARWQQQCSHR